jgi:hypothetical protein
MCSDVDKLICFKKILSRNFFVYYTVKNCFVSACTCAASSDASDNIRARTCKMTVSALVVQITILVENL